MNGARSTGVSAHLSMPSGAVARCTPYRRRLNPRVAPGFRFSPMGQVCNPFISRPHNRPAHEPHGRPVLFPNACPCMYCSRHSYAGQSCPKRGALL